MKFMIGDKEEPEGHIEVTQDEESPRIIKVRGFDRGFSRLVVHPDCSNVILVELLERK